MRNSQSMAEQRLKEDPQAYYTAFRDTIEVILVPPEEEKDDEKVEKIDETEDPALQLKQPISPPKNNKNETVNTDTGTGQT